VGATAELGPHALVIFAAHAARQLEHLLLAHPEADLAGALLRDKVPGLGIVALELVEPGLVLDHLGVIGVVRVGAAAAGGEGEGEEEGKSPHADSIAGK
jgi:hypothetical protein